MKYLVILLTAFLVACASTSNDTVAEGSQRLGVDQLGRTPLPVGAKIRGPESLIIGVGDNWLGRAVIELQGDASYNYNFFADQFPRQGWSVVSAVRGKRSLLVFTRSDRSLSVELDEAGGLMGGMTATLTMSPSGVGVTSAPTGQGVVVQPVSPQRRP
jgi:hypothetical protein